MSGDTDRKRSVFTFAPGAPFAKSLAQLLLDETAGDPETLARYKVLLPTRRACRTVRESFLRLSGGAPILLPALLPIGDVDEGDLFLQMFGADGRFLDIPPAMPALRRQLMLAKMLQAGGDFASSPMQALKLAASLAGLLDQMTIEGISFDALKTVVPEEFAFHWQITLKFLDIIGTQWPKILDESGMIDPVQRRNLLLGGLSEYLTDFPSKDPIIAAGTTGSIPATARLLDTISLMPCGRVILPGLDCDLDTESWEKLDETHPQFLMKILLSRIGLDRTQVRVVGITGDDRSFLRKALAREITRPAATCQFWQDFGQKVRDQHDPCSLLEGLKLYVCDTSQEEALVIALAMREALEIEGKTVCLITPDRSLALRVAAQLLRWGVLVDDSAGRPLRDTPVGIFLSLLLSAARRRLEPAALLALLRHPLCGMGIEAHALESFAEILDRRIFRTEEFRLHTLQGLISLCTGSDFSALEGACARLSDALSPLVALDDGRDHDFGEILSTHLRAAEHLASHPDLSGSLRLWQGGAGAAAAAFLTDLQAFSGDIKPLDYASYQAFSDFLMDELPVRAAYGLHPRVSILGQLEARMTDADIVILGGLNEGTWPQGRPDDPWLSLPMRKKLGLPSPERSVGLSAHDFTQGFFCPDLYLTRSRKVDGAPTVAARWLQKLETVLRGCDIDPNRLSSGPHLKWAREIEKVTNVTPIARPAPRPPTDLRPTKVSVTRVQSWLEDPYSHYARYTLKLRKLPALSPSTDQALYGKIIHKALETFFRTYPETLPSNAETELIKYFQSAAEQFIPEPKMLRFWMMRMEDPLKQVLAKEQEWRRRYESYGAEVRGEIDLSVAGRRFVLEGRADRIDKSSEGYALIDYKTGGAFAGSKLQKGEYPQLPLQGLILRRGGFEKKCSDTLIPLNIPPGPVSYLGYWQIRAGFRHIQEIYSDADTELMIDYAEQKLLDLFEAFYNEEVAYLALPNPFARPRFNDYEHLERVAEWSVTDLAVPERNS